MTQTKRDPGDTALPTTVEIFVERRPGGAGQPSEVDAFADLYNRTYNPLVSYCRRYCPPGYDPEDIAQEALAKAWSSWDRYSPSRPFWPWVATIARRLCVDYWRRDERAIARAGGVAALEPCPQPRPDELSETADECRMAVTAFRRLRPDHQRIVGLRDIEGWSYEDIARFEGVTVESIRGSLRRARLSLRKSYDSLAKGGVPVLVPVAAFVRAFQAARVRLATRLARWQATLQDAGVASTRLGEALVSLMAISVAAVGLGSPVADVAVRADTAPPAAVADAVGSAGAVAASPEAGVGGGFGGNAAPSTNAPNASWRPTELGTEKLVPGGTATLEDGGALDFEPSPHYQTDRTIFATGPRLDCGFTCYSIFKSTNGGADWTDLRTTGLVNHEIILPPAYPDDRRMFATGSLGLQVSNDGGRTFDTVLPSWGTAAMSPAFSSGDPRILLPDSPGMQYNGETGLLEPLNLRPGPSSVAVEFRFGFPSKYDPTNPVIFIGAQVPNPPGYKAAFYRCEGTVCSDPVELPGMSAAPRIVVVPRPEGDVILATTGGNLQYRSLDGGRSFQAVRLPPHVGSSFGETADRSGRVYLVSGDRTADFGDVWYSDDAGSNWLNIPDPVANDTQVNAVTALPDGSLLVGIWGKRAGAACTRDVGRTWSRGC